MVRPKKDIFCLSCKKKIEKGEEYENIRQREEDGSKGKGYWEGNNYCLPCYENRERERQEARERAAEKQKQEALDRFEAFDNECMNAILLIGMSLEGNFCEVNDYRKLKNLQKKLNSWPNRWKEEYIEGRKKDLENALQELEANFPEQIKVKVKNQGKKCRHGGIIHWPRAKGENPYCLDCGENKSNAFLKKLQKKHASEIRSWFESQNLNPPSILKETSYQQFVKLSLGEFTNLSEIQKVRLNIEKELNEIATKKGLDNPWKQYQQLDNNNDPKKEQLRQDIQNLENKPNRTEEEEKELENKKKKLEDLEEKQKNNPSAHSNSFNYTPWLIGGIFFIIALVLFTIYKKKKKLS